MAEAPPRRTPWLAVSAVLGAGVVAAFQIGKLPAALPALRADLGLGLVTGGWVISTISGVGVATGMAWGVIADRLGHRRVVLTGLAVIALGSLLGARAADGTGLLLTRLVEGLGYIAVIAAAPSVLVGLATARDRSLTMAVWSFYLPFGLSGMVVISPAVLALGSWRGLWLLNAGLAAVALLAAAAATAPYRARLPAPARAASGGALRAVWRTLSAPGPPVLALSFGAYSLIHLSVMAFLPTFLVERQGMTAGEAAPMVAFAMFMNAPGCLLGGWLMRLRWPAWRLVALGYLGMLGCAFGVFSEGIDPGLRYALAIALPFSGGLIPPAVLERAPAHAASPELVATCVGLIVQVISLGQLLGPPMLAAIVAGSGSWQSASWLTGGAAAVGLLAAAALRHLDRGRPGGLSR